MSKFSRRKFLTGMAVAPVALKTSLLNAKTLDPRKRLPLGFSTLGCPAWEWHKILDFAQQHGFAAVELRGLQGSMDLPSRPEFSPERLSQSMKEVSDHGLHIACVSSSSEMHETDPGKNEAQLADARRFIDLASQMGVPYVRVFGNQITGPRDQVISHVAAGLRQLGDYAGPKNVTVILESHGDFTDSPTLRSVMEQADSPHVALLWDANHTYVDGKEEPEVTIAQVGKYIRHTHLKDCVRQGKDVHYVLTGRGMVPVKRQIELLVKMKYTGYYSFEWEKAWHPDLEDPEIALADYARVASGYLKDAHYKAHR